MSFADEYVERFREAYREFAEECRKESVYGDLFVIDGHPLGTLVRLAGVDVPVASFMSLEYLGIGNEPEIIEAGTESLRRYGSGFASSRTTIDSSSHLAFEAALADFKRAEACVLTNTGYDASHMLLMLSAGPMQALRKRFSGKQRTFVCMDELSHASLQDAFLRLKQGRRDISLGARYRKYRHLDYAMLCEMLESAPDDDLDRFIVTDTLFSIHGDTVDVKRLLDIAKRYRAFLLLDGAHSDGVYGPEGRGMVEEAGIRDANDLSRITQSGTLSKAFAGMGGYVTSFPALAELARNSQWKYIFSAGMPMFQAAMYRKTLEVIRGPKGEDRRRRLDELSFAFRQTLAADDFCIFGSTSHVVPVLIGEESLCLEVQDYLVREHASLCGAIRFPAVPENEAVLRIALSAVHTDAQIERLVFGLRRAREKYRFGHGPRA